MVATPRLSLTRWLTLLVLAAVLPLLVFGALTLAWLTASYRTTADRGQADITRALALAIDAEIRAWKAALLALAETNELRAGRLKDFHAEATQVAGRYNGWIGLTDGTGQQVMNTARAYGDTLPATGVPATVATVFRERKPAVSDVRQGTMAPLFLITVAVPVVRDNEVRYTLHLSVEPETLNATLAAQHLPPSWVAAVVDSQHRVVARWPHRPERVGQPVVPRLQTAFGSRAHGFVESDTTEGRDVRVAFEHLNEAPWVVSIVVPLAELHAAWRRPLVGFLLIGALLGLLAVGFAVALSRRIARPIHELARDSHLMLRGDLIPANPSSRIEEVHRLQEALVAGAEQAQAYYRERERSARAEEAARAAAASAQALRESQQRIERQLAEIAAIYDSAPVGLCVLDPDLRYVRVNESFAAMVGLTPAEHAGRSVHEVCPGLAAQAEALLGRVIETGAPVRDVEVVGTTPAQPGVQRTWIEHWLPLKDAAGRVVAVNIVAEEVTERRRAEAERESLARFPEQNPHPVLRVARDATLLYANPASRLLLDMWGCRVGKPLSPLAQAALGKALIAGQNTEVEVECGEGVYSLVSVPFEGEGYVNVYGRDITERKRAETALAEQKTLLQTILEQAAEEITVRDAEGRVTFVNAVARRRALRPPEGTTLETAPEVWGPYLDGDGKPVPIGRWPMTRALQGEKATAELQRVTPGGTIVVLNSAAPLRNDTGEIIGAVAVTTDISERKRVENDLRQALAQEQAALAENQTLLREVHHRVKNNLQMLCDLMYLQLDTMEHPEQHQDLQDAYSRVYAIARLHEQLYKAMQSGRVQLAEYLARLVEGFRDFSSQVQIRLDAAIDPQVSLDMDRAIHAGLIVNELITNSLKHAFPGGKAGGIIVSLRGKEDRLQLEVRDNGVGLPPGLDLGQAKSLGLRMVHILARRLQATVDVENDNGTTFTVTFPLQAEVPVEPKPE